LYSWDNVYFFNKSTYQKFLNFFNYDETFLFDTLLI
jgi:hypothetical protein